MWFSVTVMVTVMVMIMVTVTVTVTVRVTVMVTVTVTVTVYLVSYCSQHEALRGENVRQIETLRNLLCKCDGVEEHANMAHYAVDSEFMRGNTIRYRRRVTIFHRHHDCHA